MICTANKNGAPCAAYSTARLIITTASASAACTAFLANSSPSAATTMIGARIQNAVMPTPPHPAEIWRVQPAKSPSTGYLACSTRQNLVGGGSFFRHLDDGQLLAAVVVMMVVADQHLVRRLGHAGEQWRQQVVLLPDHVGPVVARHVLVVVGHGQRTGRARLDAQTAQDAARVVDLINPPVAFAGAEPVAFDVGGAFDVDRVGRAGPRT